LGFEGEEKEGKTYEEVNPCLGDLKSGKDFGGL